MRARRLVALGLGLALLIGSAAVVIDRLPGGEGTRSEAVPAPGMGTPSPPEPGYRPVPPAGGQGDAGARGAEPANPPVAPAPAPATADPVHPREVLPPSGGTPGALPGSVPLVPLVSRPLPATASADGTIVTGYPDAILPPAPRSSIVTSSVSSEDATLQAGLSATAETASESVLSFYRSALSAQGFTGTPTDALAGSAAVRWARGTDSVTVTVSADGGRARYSVFGVLHAGRA